MTGSTTGGREGRKRRLRCLRLTSLIPEDKLSGKLREEWVQESLDPVPELAEEFQVSENFMRKRLKLRESSSNKV
jgi:hypothetical protein